MKTILIFLSALLIIIAGCFQRRTDGNLLLCIKWDDNILQKRSFGHTVQSIEAYCFIDENTIALLNSEEQRIIVYSLTSKTIEKSIQLPYGALDFDFHNGKFHVFDYNRVYVINENNQVEQEFHYIIPERTPFALEKFKVIAGRNIITIADGTTWALSASGLEKIDNYYWHYKGGIKARAEKSGFKSFEISVNSANIASKKSTITINNLGLNDDLATVRIVDINDRQIAFDIETATDIESETPKRFLIFTDLSGNLISKTEIPFVCSTWIKYPFIKYKNGVVYSLSSIDGLYFYEINPQKKTINLPNSTPKSYHFNDYLEIIDPIDLNDNIEFELKSTNAGNNCVTRTQVWANAYKFRDLVWTASSSNFVTSCTTIAGGWVRTPSNPGVSQGWIVAGSNASVPYKWGGFTDWNAFENLAAQGKKTGNMAIWKDTNSNYLCGSRNAHIAWNDNDVIGVDCSGFVSRCWETTRHTTHDLSNISTNHGAAYKIKNFNNLLPGDIVNYAAHHTMIFLEHNPSGEGSFIEAHGGNQHGSGGWKVNVNSKSMTFFSQVGTNYDNRNYVVLRYNHIYDARLRLAQAITITPTHVLQGGPLTVSYRIGNYGSESWTGHVELWIIQSNGNEMFLQSTSSPITLGQNQTSNIYTYNTNTVTSPAGTTKLEVRLKNSSTCNYQRSYAVGNSGFSNPLIFTINLSSI